MQQSEKVLKCLKITLHRSLPNNIETKVVHTGAKLCLNFQIKDKTQFDHKHLVHYVKCLECQEDYIVEVDTRLHEQIFDQSGKDRKSHTSKHSLKNNYKHVSFEDFRILPRGYINSNLSRI